MAAPNYTIGIFFGIDPAEKDQFGAGLQQAAEAAKMGGVFYGDNLFTFGRNLSFLDDTPFFEAVRRHSETRVEKALIWRHAVLAWAARQGLRLDGDFVECACYKGTSARILCDTLDFGKRDKTYWLYDLFEHDESMAHHAMPEHGDGLYEQVKARFADTPNVRITRGAVPAVLHEAAPEKIAFMHLDLNNADAEIGALELLFDRMLPGAMLVLDDYGWLNYRAQKLAEDAWFAKRGYHVLELPTGQGLLIK
ncbi:TylF/MycF/NovP-related O-methyltransferase [Ferrovibrio sp.]|uniref:TylF/MycF/NovP-related O-methyltransferase n=1 Tax=Ferrovibrio sp. TaxID=1917215 RepID=UPI0025B8FBC6|nr:TylF/MycF/NovP-related O-methyltransferase [Ferrovibrio sp.]MBX3453379.1 class I SAM-dependent methyltransferase [Ferrovibrio sp.]